MNDAKSDQLIFYGLFNLLLYLLAFFISNYVSIKIRVEEKMKQICSILRGLVKAAD